MRHDHDINGIWLSYYGYDASSGERSVKHGGRMNADNVNGKAGYYCSLYNTHTLYASPYVVATPKGYTKHYYAGSDRIASRIGGGGLDKLHNHVVIPEGKLTQMNERVCEGWRLHYFCREDAEPERSRSLVVAKPEPEELPPCSENEYTIYFNTELRLLYEYKDIRHDEPEIYFYHPDHLGSSSWITDRTGDAVQHLQYLPFGEQYVDQRATGWNAMFTFSGKERDEETGYSYFGARYYDSDLSIWLSVDPLMHKYPSLSPYVYCANNPIMLVDPDGMDIWDINENGQVVGRTKDKTQDAFRRVDSDGKPIEGEGNSITFKYGTIKERNHSVKTVRGDKTLKIFEVKGDQNATDAFNFLIGGGGEGQVEWGHVKIGEEGSGRNLLGTANEESSSYIEGYALAYNYTIREANHNHPSGNPIPSEGEVNGAKAMSDKFKNATFNIYKGPNDPVSYNKKSDYVKPHYPGAKTGAVTPGKNW